MQATITAIAEDKKSFTVKVHAGYPGSPGHPGVFEMSKGRMVMLFDGQTRLPRTSVWGDMYEHGIEPVPDQEGCYVFQAPPPSRCPFRLPHLPLDLLDLPCLLFDLPALPCLPIDLQFAPVLPSKGLRPLLSFDLCKAGRKGKKAVVVRSMSPKGPDSRRGHLRPADLLCIWDDPHASLPGPCFSDCLDSLLSLQETCAINQSQRTGGVLRQQKRHPLGLKPGSPE